MTLAETRLWAELRRGGLHFRRQAPIGRYIADFVSHECRLVVELDGAPHELFAEVALRDQARDAWFSSQGYRTLRFTNAEVLDGMEKVLRAILAAVQPPPSPTLPPSRGKGE
jgi:very-short-patch-repair endonuclease